MLSILPQLVVFVVGALISLAKENSEKKSKAYWITLAINSLLIFAIAEVALFFVEKKYGRLTEVVGWLMWFSIGVLSNVCSDLISNTERKIERSKTTILDIIPALRKVKDDEKDA